MKRRTEPARSRLVRRLPILIATIFSAVLVSSCASLSYESRHQYVLVRSDPPGADIYSEGKKVGTTPAYVEVHRAKQGELELKTSTESKPIPIDTNYRWSGSFWPNVALLPFAPVGWLVDLATGSAWEMQDPEPVSIQGRPRDFAKKPSLMAIAPPWSESMKISDEAGLLWGKKLESQYPSMRFRPYEQTLSVFTGNGYDFDHRPDADEEHRIFGQLGVSSIFESKLSAADTGIRLKGDFRDVYSGARGTDHVLDIAPTQGEGSLSWYEKLESWFYLIPNTVGIDWASRDAEFDSGAQTYSSQAPSNSSLGYKALSLFDALDFTHLNPPRHESSSRFRFAFTPAVRFSWRKMVFPGFQPFQNTKFTYFLSETGLGPELGWQSGPHYLYIKYIPMLGWHHLSWNSSTSSLFAVSEKVEIGYLYFFTQNMSAHFFSQATTMPNDIWNAAISNLSPGSPPVSNAYDVAVGLTFSYTFEPERHLQNWDVQGRSPSF